jgi:hypothetical protein
MPTWLPTWSWNHVTIHKPDENWPDILGVPRASAIMTLDELSPCSISTLAYSIRFGSKQAADACREAVGRISNTSLWAEEVIFIHLGKKLHSYGSVEHPYWDINLVSLRAQTPSYIARQITRDQSASWSFPLLYY